MSRRLKGLARAAYLETLLGGAPAVAGSMNTDNEIARFMADLEGVGEDANVDPVTNNARGTGTIWNPNDLAAGVTPLTYDTTNAINGIGVYNGTTSNNVYTGQNTVANNNDAIFGVGTAGAKTFVWGYHVLQRQGSVTGSDFWKGESVKFGCKKWFDPDYQFDIVASDGTNLSTKNIRVSNLLSVGTPVAVCWRMALTRLELWHTGATAASAWDGTTPDRTVDFSLALGDAIGVYNDGNDNGMKAFDRQDIEHAEISIHGAAAPVDTSEIALIGAYINSTYAL